MSDDNAATIAESKLRTEDDFKTSMYPGALMYRSLDGKMLHWPGELPWTPDRKTAVDDLDLLNLWVKMARALRKIAQELERRGVPSWGDKP